MDDQEVRAMNRRMQLGWEPSRHQWQTVAQRCKDMDEMRHTPIWGLRQQFHGLTIVPYPQFFHPKGIVGSNMTYDEAEALKKLMES